MNVLTKLACTLVAVGALGGAATQAEAADYYGMVTINNPTHLTVTYSFQWGNGNWETFTLLPGESRWHAWPFDYPNQHLTPAPRVRFDSDLLPGGVYFSYYDLVANSAPYTDGYFGSQYSFQVSWDGSYLYLVQ